MDPSSCVMEVELLVSSRGTPAMIWSDNGTNYIGPEKELRVSIENWNTVINAAQLAHKGKKIKFNPPSAPHQGGIWERLVRSFNCVLYTILDTRRLMDEELNTTFCLVEHALNSRPLTHGGADPCILNAITPNQFLLGENSTVFRLLSAIINLTIVNVTPSTLLRQLYAITIWSR